MNQDRIKDRILRRAARMWGYNELEAETSFDPIISLLLSACAAELEKVGFELESSRSRIIERVLDVMFPEEVSGVVPARTLLQVNPLENNSTISLYNSFKATVRKQNIYNPAESIVKDIYFSPTIEAGLTTAKLKYFAYGDSLHQVESFFFDDLIGKAETHLPSGELWLGIHSPNKENLENLMFFIDINNTYQKELFFHYLQQVKVYFGEKEFLLKEGYNVEKDGLNLEDIITKNYTDLQQIYNEVNQYYLGNFYTLKGIISFSENPEISTLFTQNFPAHKAGEEDDIIWLRFQFSEAIIPEILQNVRFALNCIPVVNIHHKEIDTRVKGRLDIIPIQIEDENFLDLDCVREELTGRRLDIKNYDASGDSVTAVIRKGGVARFDRRNASELLQYLLELIKDETAAFSSLGLNSTAEVLKQINQNVASLHQSAKENNFVQNESPYLLISSLDKENNMSCKISYWLTMAEEGNDIKTGSTLDNISKGKVMLVGNGVMIRTSVGGRKKLSPQDKILEYRSALLTRGRIVTIADIRAFGMNHFKNTITGIEVQKGTKKEVSLKGGFSRTIDVYLLRKKDMDNMKEEEWTYLCESFLLKLKNASANIYPYRLFEK